MRVLLWSLLGLWVLRRLWKWLSAGFEGPSAKGSPSATPEPHRTRSTRPVGEYVAFEEVDDNREDPS